MISDNPGFEKVQAWNDLLLFTYGLKLFLECGVERVQNISLGNNL